MKLTANHLTILRIVLLPVPFFLIYGDQWSRVLAIAAYTVLGFTDYLDGLLARKHGPTRLGAMLDPIADKIFVVVTYVPLVDLGVVPLWVACAMFFREYLVTELRYFMSQSQKELKVTEIAKIKTTIQMIGAGVLLLTDTFPDKWVTGAGMAGALIATVFAGIGIYWKEGRIPDRLKTATGFLCLGLGVLAAFEIKQVHFLYSLIILAITYISARQYLMVGLHLCIKKGLAASVKLFMTLALPITALILMPFTVNRFLGVVVVIAIMSMEFVSQAIDMVVIKEGGKNISWVKNFVIFPCMVLAMLGFFAMFEEKEAAKLFLITFASFSICYAVTDMWMNRGILR